jgi:twitching motility protein PilT
VRIQLASIIKAVISQRLVPKSDGKGRVPAVEVMLASARVRECIDDKDKTKQLNDAISQGYVTYGMQSFDQSLMKLYSNKLITYEEALRQCSNPDDFALKVSGISSTSDASWDDFENKPGDPAAELEKLDIERY